MTVILTLAVYFVAMAVIGIIGYRKTKATDINDMFLASGTLSPFIVFITSCATCFSAFAFLGAPSYFYSYGVTSVLYMAPIVADLTFMAIVARGFWLLSKKYHFVTPADLLSARYDYKNDKTVRFLVAIACLVFCIFYIQLNFTGSGYVIETVTEGAISYKTGIILVAAFVGFYTIMGGMRSVAWTDTAQAILLFAALAVISGIAIAKGGGTHLFENVFDAFSQFGTMTESKIYAYTCMLGVAISMPVWPTMWQRCYTGRRFKGTVIGFVQGEAVGVFFLCILFPAIIGGAGILLFPNLEGLMSDKVTILYFAFVPGVLAGLFAVGALAAAMSTADALTLLLGSIVVNDIALQIRPDMSEKGREITSRTVCLAVILVSLVIALNPIDLLVAIAFKLAWPGAACFFPLVIGAIFWKRASREGGITGLIGAFVSVILTTIVWPDALGIYSAVWGAGAGFIGLIAGSLLSPPPPQEVVDKFHGFLSETYKYKGIDTGDDVMIIKVP